jgi:hypothetical protein
MIEEILCPVKSLNSVVHVIAVDAKPVHLYPCAVTFSFRNGKQKL